MSILKFLVILLIIYILWKIWSKRENLISIDSDIYHLPIASDIANSKKYFNSLKNSTGKSYMEQIKNNELDEETVQAHYRDIVKQGPIYSSGAGFSIVEPDNTSPMFSNYTAFSRPEYVPIQPNPRQLQGEDISLLMKNNRRPITGFLPGH